MQKRCNSLTCPSTDAAEKLCGRCRITRYCSLLCQRNDWKVHRKTCCEFGMQSDQERSNGKRDKFDIDGESMEELIQQFDDLYDKGNAAIHDVKKRIKHFKRAVYLEDNYLKRFYSELTSHVPCNYQLMHMFWLLGEDHDFQRPATAAIGYFRRAIELSKLQFPLYLSLGFDARMLDSSLRTQYDCHLGLGKIFLQMSNVKAAEIHCIESLPIGHSLYGGDKLAGNEKLYVKCLLLEGMMRMKLFNYPLGILYHEKAYDCLKRSVNEDDVDLKKCTDHLIEAYLQGGLLEKASVLLTELLEYLKLSGKSEELVYAERLRYWADCLMLQRRFSEATAAAQEAIDIFAPYHSTFSAHYGFTVLVLAQTRLYQQQLDEETESLLLKACELESVHNSGSSNVANMQTDLGLFYLRTGNTGQALQQYEAAYAILHENHPDGPVAKTLGNIVFKLRAGDVHDVLQLLSTEYV